MTGTIWLPYVLRVERRNVYPCSFHHYNNMSKEPPLSRKAHRNTKKKKTERKKPRQSCSTWHHPWKRRCLKSHNESEVCSPHSLATATAPVDHRGAGQDHQGWTLSPAAHSKRYAKHLIYSCFTRLTNSL